MAGFSEAIENRSMRRPFSCFILSSLLLGACVDVQAIAVDDYSVAETNPAVAGYSLDWDYIYKYKNASSVAVDHYWILTAAHVADDGGTGSLVVDGETYTQQEIVFHDTADLALVRYDKPFPGYYLLHDDEIYTGPKQNPSYQELLMAGYGYAGTVSATSFTQSGVAGIKRWGTNRGEGEATLSADITNPSDGIIDVTTKCFLVNFDLGNTAYEAGANTYDSGGPVFIYDEEASEWTLTGINLYRSGTGPYTGNAAAMIHDYISWIKSVIVDYDTDMDGLPDWWEAEHGETEAGDDPDGDGFTNYDEWLADTLPNDGNSFLRVMEYTNATSLVFSSSTNRKYQVQYRIDLADTNEVWQTEPGADWDDGSYPQTARSVSTATSNRFYRVRAKLR